MEFLAAAPQGPDGSPQVRDTGSKTRDFELKDCGNDTVLDFKGVVSSPNSSIGP
jgi:hypothetical protein